MTKTEEYINKAVQKAKKELAGNTIANNYIHVDAQVQAAWEDLLQCVHAQIKVNSDTVSLLDRISCKLQTQNIYGINITNK